MNHILGHISLFLLQSLKLILALSIELQKYDAVVGDTTIIANRSKYVDFTLPYTESGVSMVVLVKKDDNTNIWIFLQPLTTDLWLASLAFFFFTGFVVWVVEHRINEEFRGPPSQQMGTIFYFAFSTLVFAHSKSSFFFPFHFEYVINLLIQCDDGTQRRGWKTTYQDLQ